MIKLFINPYDKTKVEVNQRSINNGEPQSIAIDYNGYTYLLELTNPPILKTLILDKFNEPYKEIDKYRTKI